MTLGDIVTLLNSFLFFHFWHMTYTPWHFDICLFTYHIILNKCALSNAFPYLFSITNDTQISVFDAYAHWILICWSEPSTPICLIMLITTNLIPFQFSCPKHEQVSSQVLDSGTHNFTVQINFQSDLTQSDASLTVG